MRYLITVLCSLVMTACSFLKPENKPVHMLTVQYATGKFIESSNDPGGRAARILEVIESVQAVNDGEPITIALLQARAFAAIEKSNLGQADAQLARNLVLVVKAEIESRVKSGAIPEGAELQLSEVFVWVGEAARAYLPER